MLICSQIILFLTIKIPLETLRSSNNSRCNINVNMQVRLEKIYNANKKLCIFLQTIF
jgi:hypothetical protein